MSAEEREIETVLLFDRRVGEGAPVAAVAWEGETWSFVPAPRGDPTAAARFIELLGTPIGRHIEALQQQGYASTARIVRAVRTADAARTALREAGVEE